MPVEEAALTAVRGLLKSSAAYLVSGGKSGTGFFIDQGLCLTCAHVVGTVGQAVSVQPFGREPREGEVVKSSVDADLALVRVPQLPHEDEAPIAVLHLGVDDDARYYAIGYPRNDVARDAGQEEIAYRGHGRRLGPTVTLLDLEAGQASVSPGLSGGPVLSAESGAVVAIVQYRAESTPASGGGAIPIERAAATFPEVAARIVTPPITSRAWREALGREPWNALGHSWGWAVQVDLSVGGDRRQWSVRIREPWSAERSTTYNVGNIPPEIPAALFDWAQHRRIGNRADAALVGRLLSGVVMPSGTTSLKSVAAPDEVLIRLDIDAGSGLFDVPWEFLTVGDEGAERHVAFEEGFSFARVVDRADATPPDLAPAQSGALALGVIVQPTGWQREMPILRHKNPSIPWPSPAAIREARVCGHGRGAEDAVHSRAQ